VDSGGRRRAVDSGGHRSGWPGVALPELNLR
jgi:hypothetical protein